MGFMSGASSGGGGVSDIVEDTSPQLGGNLDVNTKNIAFGDSGGASDDRLTFGAGTDLSIYHDGTDSKIDGALRMTGEVRSERAKVITLSTGGGNTLTQATHGGAYCYVTAGNVTLFNIANVGDQVLIMNDSGGSITLGKDGSHTIVGATTILDEATVTCVAVTSSKWFVIG